MLWPHMKGLKQMIKLRGGYSRDERSSSRASLHSVSNQNLGVDLILTYIARIMNLHAALNAIFTYKI